MFRKSRAVIGVSAIAALIFATGANFTARPIPTVFNPAIVQAMDAIAGHTTLALNAPTLLPHRSSGYLTAMTAALPDAYQVTVWDTRQPLHVNNAAIVSERMSGGNVAQFGAVRLAHSQPSHVLTTLEQHNPLWARGPATKTSLVNLGDGIRVGRDHVGTHEQLWWTEGDWWIQVDGQSLNKLETTADSIIHFLQTAYLPPYPGSYAVRLQDKGHQAITSLDWVRGQVLSYVTNDHASATNPVVTGSMAVSWRADSIQRAEPHPYAVNSRITITNPTISQILAKVHSGQLYGINAPQFHNNLGVIFLTPTRVFTPPPTTLRHWPPQGFRVYAVLSNPAIQLGGPNATAWIQGLSHEFHWLQTAPGLSPQVTVLPPHSIN